MDQAQKNDSALWNEMLRYKLHDSFSVKGVKYLKNEATAYLVLYVCLLILRWFHWSYLPSSTNRLASVKSNVTLLIIWPFFRKKAKDFWIKTNLSVFICVCLFIYLSLFFGTILALVPTQKNNRLRGKKSYVTNYMTRFPLKMYQNALAAYIKMILLRIIRCVVRERINQTSVKRHHKWRT